MSLPKGTGDSGTRDRGREIVWDANPFPDPEVPVRKSVWLLPAMAVTAGCSMIFGPSVTKAALEEEVKAHYTREGIEVLGVSCDSELSGPAGGGQLCRITAPHGVEYHVYVTITGTRDGELTYTFELGGGPPTSTPTP